MYNQERFDEALAEFQQALRLDPNSARTHFMLGMTLLKLDRRAAAATHFAEALKRQPDYPEARQQMRDLTR